MTNVVGKYVAFFHIGIFDVALRHSVTLEFGIGEQQTEKEEGWTAATFQSLTGVHVGKFVSEVVATARANAHQLLPKIH